MLIYGSKGTGKTVLLHTIRDAAQADSILVTSVEASKQMRLPQLLTEEVHRVLRALARSQNASEDVARAANALRNFGTIHQIPIADFPHELQPDLIGASSGDSEVDLPELFTLIGTAARSAGRVWLLLVDEMQSLENQDLSALTMALHQISQDSLPVVFVGAGLPSLIKDIGNAKPYAERLFQFHALDALSSGVIDSQQRTSDTVWN